MAKKKRKRQQHWQRSSYGLPKNHQWKARPGNKVFVADRGKAQFEIPGDWEMSPGESGSIRFFDKPEADADMRLEISLIYVPPIDWTGLSLTKLLEEGSLAADTRGITGRGPFQEWQRGQDAKDKLEAAWLEVDFHDPNEDRPAHSRVCMARGPGVYSFITMDFWPEDAPRAHQVWDCVMDTLKLGGETLNLDGSKQTPLRRLSMN